MITVEELAQAMRDVMRETDGYPCRVARELYYCLSRTGALLPLELARAMVNDILCELEVQWDREEDAPTWPDD